MACLTNKLPQTTENGGLVHVRNRQRQSLCVLAAFDGAFWIPYCNGALLDSLLDQFYIFGCERQRVTSHFHVVAGAPCGLHHAFIGMSRNALENVRNLVYDHMGQNNDGHSRFPAIGERGRSGFECRRRIADKAWRRPKSRKSAVSNRCCRTGSGSFLRNDRRSYDLGLPCEFRYPRRFRETSRWPWFAPQSTFRSAEPYPGQSMLPPGKIAPVNRALPP